MKIRKTIIFALIAASFAVFFVLRPASPPQAPAFDRERNFKVRVEADGRRMATARWAIVPEDVRILRYPWIYDGSKMGYTFPLFGKDYEDPNVYGPGIGTIFLEALLPNFEAKTDIDDPRFKDGYLGDVIQMNISATGPTARGGNRKGLPVVESNFNTIYDVYFSEAGTERDRKNRNLEYQVKPDRFGLKHFGPVGNFDEFREFGYIRDIYYLEKPPKDRFMACAAEEIKENLEDPTWHRKTSCEHWYYSSFLNGEVKLSYRRSYLKDWQKLEQDTEAFFKKNLDIKQFKGEQ